MNHICVPNCSTTSDWPWPVAGAIRGWMSSRAVSMTGGPIMASYAMVNRHFAYIIYCLKCASMKPLIYNIWKMCISPPLALLLPEPCWFASLTIGYLHATCLEQDEACCYSQNLEPHNRQPLTLCDLEFVRPCKAYEGHKKSGLDSCWHCCQHDTTELTPVSSTRPRWLLQWHPHGLLCQKVVRVNQIRKK